MRFKRTKYGNVKTAYKGDKYDSKLEARVAQRLDLAKKASSPKDKVIKWERQHKISLDVNGEHIANYIIDFVAEYADGRKEYIEAKGRETSAWRLKWKLTKALYPHYKLVLIKK